MRDGAPDATASADAPARRSVYEEAVAAERFLAARGYYAVRDAGAERHLLHVTPRPEDDDAQADGGAT